MPRHARLELDSLYSLISDMINEAETDIEGTLRECPVAAIHFRLAIAALDQAKQFTNLAIAAQRKG